MNGDGTKKRSILALSCLWINFNERYFPMMARSLIGFLVGWVLMKLLSVNGVLTCLSCCNVLGNGAKYPRSWNIIRFFAFAFLLARIGARPRYLMTLWYRIRSGLNFSIFLWSFIVSRKLPSQVIMPRYFANLPSGHPGTLPPQSSTSYPCCSNRALTSLM